MARKPIHHPADGDIVSPAFFAAFGFVEQVEAIYCVLLNYDYLEVGQYNVLMQPDPQYDGFWSVEVWGVPNDRRPHLLRLHNAETGEPIHESKDLRFRRHIGSSITWPPSNFNVSKSFTAYGPTDDTSVEATMDAIAGTSSVNTAAHSWSSIFLGLPVRNGYTLYLYDSTHQPPNYADRHTNINVQ